MTAIAVLSLGGNNGCTDLSLSVGDRIEAIRALVFGGSLLDPGHHFAPGILPFVLKAYKKLPISFVPTSILVIILVAHGGSWNKAGTGKSNSVSGKPDREIAGPRSKAANIKCR